MRKVSYLILMGIAIFVVSACGPAETPVPTVDLNLLATDAAATIAAQYTQTAWAMPTETPAPTYTPIIPTEIPTMMAIPTIATGGDAAAIPSVGEAIPTIPAALPTATLGKTGNQCVYSDQSIKDGTVFKAGQTADLIWYVTNTGTTTWRAGALSFYYTAQGDEFLDALSYALPKDVAPGETYVFSGITGRFNTNYMPCPSGWAFGADGKEICSFSLMFTN